MTEGYKKALSMQIDDAFLFFFKYKKPENQQLRR